MNLNIVFFSLTIAISSLFGSEAGSINIFVSIPTVPSSSNTEGEETLSIEGFYTANHQHYSLTPESLEKKIKQNSPLNFSFSNLPEEKLILLHLKVEKAKGNDLLYISIHEKDRKNYSLISLDKDKKDIPIKLFWIDTKNSSSPIEIQANQKFEAKMLYDKILFAQILESNAKVIRGIDLNNYFLPLEVNYFSP